MHGSPFYSIRSGPVSRSGRFRAKTDQPRLGFANAAANKHCGRNHGERWEREREREGEGEREEGSIVGARKSEWEDGGLNREGNICDRISGEQWRHFRVIRLIPHPL